MWTVRCVLAAALCYGNPAIVSLKRTTKGPKVIERLRKKLSEQESLLLLMSPNMAFRVANRNGKVSHRMSEAFSKTQAQEDLLFPFNDFLMDSIFGLILFPDWPAVDSAALYCWGSGITAWDTQLLYFFQGFTFLISSDYERAEWREMIREQQKKCEHSF